MRRRLWWYIYLLDVQICEYHVISSEIKEDSVNTELPLKIDDVQIFPEFREIPNKWTRFTEMTFSRAM